MSTSDRDLRAAIAVTRFGVGARPGEIDAVAHDPSGWLAAQIRADGAPQPQTAASAVARLTELREFQLARRDARQAGPPQPTAAPLDDPVKAARKLLHDDAGGDFLARAQLAATTPDGFAERWALFFANHFTVSATKLQTATLVGPFETEAIRPHVFGRFADLLAAAESHPAMLLYLDQAQSVGPNSLLAQRLAQTAASDPARAGRRLGLNENLAREILELHTVGVHGGYSQADVTEFARAMTGLSVPGPRELQAGDLQPVIFRPAAHEPGTRQVLGVRYAETGRAQAQTVLRDLAAKPATARFVCGKIARHFVADAPPPALAARLEKAWMASGGDLAQVAQALIAAPESWQAQPAKFKTPYEFVISSYRAAGAQPTAIERIAPILTALGQKPFAAPSPKGWPEDADAWASPDGVIKRLQYAQAFSAVAVQGRDPAALAQGALGARLTPATALAVARAETRPEGLALLLMSPEFQRR